METENLYIKPVVQAAYDEKTTHELGEEQEPSRQDEETCGPDQAAVLEGTAVPPSDDEFALKWTTFKNDLESIATGCVAQDTVDSMATDQKASGDNGLVEDTKVEMVTSPEGAVGDIITPALENESTTTSCDPQEATNVTSNVQDDQAFVEPVEASMDELKNSASSTEYVAMKSEPRGAAFVPRMGTITYNSSTSAQFTENIAEAREEPLRATFIQQMTQYEGAPVAPNEEFHLKWMTFEYELEQYVANPEMLPHDTISSAGLNENSFNDYKQCAGELQDSLFEEDLPKTLGNLRGFRRLFSRSTDRILKHAFRGNPVEVLQNIYFGGTGVLPEDRMRLDDPFHHSVNQELQGETYE